MITDLEDSRSINRLFKTLRGGGNCENEGTVDENVFSLTACYVSRERPTYRSKMKTFSIIKSWSLERFNAWLNYLLFKDAIKFVGFTYLLRHGSSRLPYLRLYINAGTWWMIRNKARSRPQDRSNSILLAHREQYNFYINSIKIARSTRGGKRHFFAKIVRFENFTSTLFPQSLVGLHLPRGRRKKKESRCNARIKQ